MEALHTALGVRGAARPEGHPWQERKGRGFPIEMESVWSDSSLLFYFCFILFWFDVKGKCHSSFIFVLNI